MRDAQTLGTKVRLLRRREHMTQSQLAERLGVSASYLNLIENNRRPLTAPMLIKLAQLFQLDIAQFSANDDARVASDLLEVFGDPIFDAHGLVSNDVRELAATSPALGRAVVALYQAYRGAREGAEALAERLSESDGESMPGIDRARLPSEEVSDLIQRHMNHFPALEEAAEALRQDAKLEDDDVYRGIARHLEARLGVEVRLVRPQDERKAMRRYDPERKVLELSEMLPPRSRRFQLAHQLGLLTQGPAFDRLLEGEPLSTNESLALARVSLANYFASAVLMPYGPFLDACREARYDLEVLAHRFGASFEQVAHRLTSLRRPGQEGVPFHMLRIDIAGNISKRFSGDGIRFARFSGACPRWNVHAAFLTPGMIRTQLSRMPDGKLFFCVARTVRSDRGGYHAPHAVQAVGIGCEAKRAKELVYADGIDLDNAEAAVPVGVTCRLCDHLDCEQRVFPPLRHPLRINEHVRGVSFYAPVPER